MSYALSPVVEWLKRWYIPRAMGAALVLVVMVGSLSWIAFSLSDDAAAMIEKLPEAARKLRQNLSDDRVGPTALQNMQEAAKQIEGAAADAGAKPGGRAVATRASEPTAWLRDYAVAQLRSPRYCSRLSARRRSYCCSLIFCWPRARISDASWCSWLGRRWRAKKTPR